MEPIRFVRDMVYLPVTLRKYLRGKVVTRLDNSVGFSQVSLRDSGVGKDEILKLVNSAIKSSLDVPKVTKSAERKEYFAAIKSFEDFEPNSSEFKLATHPEIISAIQDYFGSFPYLTSIGLYWSSPMRVDKGKVEFAGSQLFHRDAEDRKIVKIWILCQEVTSESGPTILIPYKESEKIARQLNYRQGHRISIEQESNLLSQRQDLKTFSAIGPSGTVFMTDTARLLHYGSRTAKESERLVLMISYETFFSHHLRKYLSNPLPNHGVPKRILASIESLNSLQRALIRGFYQSH